MSVVAIDIGFGFTKASNGQRTLITKSILGEATDIQFRESLIGDAAKDSYMHIELDGKAYFVGELAERQSNVRSFTLDQNQFIASFVKTLALATLAQLVERNVPVNLVTGLPISYYHRYKDEMKELLAGRHNVTLIGYDGKRTETVVAINKVRVVPQPFGTLFNEMLNDMGDVQDLRFVREKIGVIDIGFRTADYTIADKMRYSERGSQTTESGMAKAFSIIANKLQETSSVNIEVYRLYEAVDRGFIKIRGKRIDLKEMVDHVFGQLASSIATEVDRLWADDWDIDQIIITGGGGKSLAPYLKPLLNGEIQSMDPGEETRLFNAKGYWRYGKHIWERVPAARAGTPTPPKTMPDGASSE